MTHRCVAANLTYTPPLELLCMESISHILILFNSSSNFIIYCTLSTHFKVFMKKLLLRRANAQEIDHHHSNSMGMTQQGRQVTMKLRRHIVRTETDTESQRERERERLRLRLRLIYS